MNKLLSKKIKFFYKIELIKLKMFKLILIFALMACIIAKPVNIKGSPLNFNLTNEEMDLFEVELDSVTDQLFGKWRVSRPKNNFI